MKNNGVLYLDEFLSNNKENSTNGDSSEQNSFKEIYEIEEYILRKQATDMTVSPAMLYQEEYFPVINDMFPKRQSEKKEKKKIKKNEVYKPKYIRGKGVLREGMCEVCNEWFRLKTSSYWYHMNFKHGIASNGSTYPDPKIIYKEGKAISICNICNKEVLLGANKKAMSYNWYKHFQKEHVKLYE
ncbi:hypothetical protein COBT_002964 [Conglomerata obtusa]